MNEQIRERIARIAARFFSTPLGIQACETALTAFAEEEHKPSKEEALELFRRYLESHHRKPSEGERPKWPEGRGGRLGTPYLHKATGRWGCLCAADTTTNELTMWFPDFIYWQGTVQELDEQFSPPGE